MLVLAAAAPLAAAGTLTNLSASAPTQVKNAVEQWTFHFQTATAVPAGGDIRIQFPSGFAANSDGNTTCDVFNPSMSGENATVVSPTEVVCELGQGNTVGGGSTVTVGFTQIRSPATVGTHTIQVQTRNAANALIDSGSATVQIREPAGPLSGLSVSAPDQTTGTTTSWAFAFTVNTTVPGDGKIRIEFPTGFQTNSGANTVCNIENPAIVYPTTVVVDQRVVLCTIGNPDSIPNGTNVQLTVSSIRNPTTEQRTLPFVIKTQTSSDAVLDQDASNQEDVLAHGFTGTPSVTVSDHRMNMVNTMSFVFTPYNAWEADGRLKISLPTGFAFDTAGPGTTVASFVAGGTGTFQAPSKNGQELTFNRSTGQIVYGGTEVRVNVTHVRNPAETFDQTGPFTLTTGNKDGGTHDVEAAPGIPITDTIVSPTTTTPANTTAAATPTNATNATNRTNATNATAGNGTSPTQGNQFTGTEGPGSIFGGDEDVVPEDTPGPGLAFALLGALIPLARWRRRRRPE